MAVTQIKSIWILLVAVYVFFYQPFSAWGFALFDHTGSDPADLQAHPKDYWSWGEDTYDIIEIKYKFDPSFQRTFPDPRITDQVELAFKQWTTAHNTPKGSMYSYLRTGYNAFVDIRSLTVHEIGHVLGLYHPNEAAQRNRNYSLQANGSLKKNPNPKGTEVMSSSTTPGHYYHVLSHDELEAYQFTYGPNKKIVFTPAENGSYDLLIRTDPALSYASSICAQVHFVEGENREPNDPYAGKRAQLMTLDFNPSFVGFSSDPSEKKPIGFKMLGNNWDYMDKTNRKVKAVKIRTRGTNNPIPLSHYDGYPGGEFMNFKTYSWDKASPPLDAAYKDDLVHIWDSPLGAPSVLVHIGLEQDVWDWKVSDESEVTFTDNTSDTNPNFVVAQEWSHTVGTQPPESPGSPGGGKKLLDRTVVARGFRLVAPEIDVTSHINTLGYADVQGEGITLAELNRDTLNQLRNTGRFVELSIEPTLYLDHGEDFVVVLEGREMDLPHEMLQSGNYLIHTHPELLDRELFVFAETESNKSVVGTYALLGTPVVSTQSVPGTPQIGTRPKWKLLVLFIIGASCILIWVWRQRLSARKKTT